MSTIPKKIRSYSCVIFGQGHENKLEQRSALICLICACFIVVWWGLAFYPFFSKQTPFPDPFFPRSSSATPFARPNLSKLDRRSLQAALSGDLMKMAHLIQEWDLDSVILISEGIPSIKRLSRKKLKQALILARRLNEGERK